VTASSDGSLGILKGYTEAEKKQRYPEEDNGR
jgi:hypothetical protein